MLSRSPTLATRYVPVFFLLLGLNLAYGATPAEELQQSLSELRVLLGDHDDARHWNQVLLTDELEQMVGSSTVADPALLQRALDAYRTDWEGLDRQRLDEVRRRLEAWSSGLTPVATVLQSQTADSQSLGDLEERIAAAKTNFQPITDEDVQRARQRLDDAIEQMRELFDESDSEQVEKWQQQIQWQTLLTELDNPEGPNLAQLTTVLQAQRGDVEGFELPPFVELRKALPDYMNAITFNRDAALTEAFVNRHLDALIESLQRFRTAPTEKNAGLIGNSLVPLERARQIPKLIAEVREEFRRPNFYVRASGDFVAAGIDDRVDEVNGIREVILGTSIRGTANLIGRVTGALQPDSQQAAIDVLLGGTAYSNNVGYNGPVTIYTRGRTAISAGTQLTIDADGIYATPAWARASTSTTINSICAKSAIVRKIAWKRACSSKGQAEYIASGRARGRVARRVNGQTDELLAEANRDFNDKFRVPLQRRDAFPHELRFNTTADALHVRATQVADAGLAGFNDPLEPSAEHAVTFQVHESMVSNLSTSMLGGELFTDLRIAELYRKAEREVPAEVLDPNQNPWGITLFQDRPISVEFENDHIKIFVRCRTLHQGENYRIVPMLPAQEILISAEYRIELVDGGVQLVRLGDHVTVEFFDRQGQPAFGTGITLIRPFLVDKFDAMLKPTLPDGGPQGIELPGRWARAGKLIAREAKSAGGWLVVGWQNQGATPSSEDESPSVDVASTEDAAAPEITQTVANEP